jgi:hypothetical protein
LFHEANLKGESRSSNVDHILFIAGLFPSFVRYVIASHKVCVLTLYLAYVFCIEVTILVFLVYFHGVLSSGQLLGRNISPLRRIKTENQYKIRRGPSMLFNDVSRNDVKGG